MKSRRLLALCLTMLSPIHVFAWEPGQLAAPPIRVLAGQSDSILCRRAVAAAEQAHGIPAHLLQAIAQVESGRPDRTSGTPHPWPWTINADGQGSFYDNKTQAVAAAVTIRPRVTRSIDVGCMQISLTNHPHAFPNLETAFDPVANAEYGARFLVALHQKTGSWAKAVQMYHSATPSIGHPYQQRVYAAWRSGGFAPNSAPSFPLASAWAATVQFHPVPVLAQQVPARIIRTQPTPSGEAPAGHTLAYYRSAPVMLAFRRR